MLQMFGETLFQNSAAAMSNRLLLADGPLGLSWQHCAATSDFLSDFYALSRPATLQAYTEARHSIGYLLNELLENAVKFRAPGDILVETSLEGGRFEAKIVNPITLAVATRFQTVLTEITTHDPGELLLARIEANALAGAEGGSGLGLLTLMSDYGARLGWIFRRDEAAGALALETLAALDLA